MKPNRPMMLALAVGFSLMVAAAALSQTPLDDDPLDDRSARRIERMEKVVRELRAIVFQGRETGQPIVVRFAVKPTSSILTQRRSVDRFGKEVDIMTKGRHDPCVGIRAVPVGEAMMACVLADHLLRHRAQNG